MHTEQKKPTGRGQLGLALVVIIAMLGLWTSSAASAPKDRVELCHMHGNGSFQLIEVAESAVSGHFGHGDGQPGGPVPTIRSSAIFRSAPTRLSTWRSRKPHGWG